MDLRAPVSTIMSTELITVSPKDSLREVKSIFEKHRIHHIPVVRFQTMVGLISKTDFFHFLRGFRKNKYDELLEESRLNNYTVEEIMTTGIAKLEPNDRINVALEVFKENLFHAIPVVEGDKLVGIVTTFDIISALADSESAPVNHVKK